MTTTTVIEPSHGWAALRVRELIAHRELAAFLVWRDITVRYRQTLLGVSWALLQPLLVMAMFSLVFGRLARMPSDGLPYPLFALSGLVAWQCFSTGLGAASNSLVSNASLLSKVYFPRLILPIAGVLPAYIDLVVALGAMVVLMAYYGVAPSYRIALLPILLVWPGAIALGAGMWLAALSMRYRDVRHALPFVTQLWMFASPVFYPLTLFPEAWHWLLGLNPMVGCLEAWRFVLLAGRAPGPLPVALSALVTLVLMVSGAFYFRRTERAFADLV